MERTLTSLWLHSYRRYRAIPENGWLLKVAKIGWGTQDISCIEESQLFCEGNGLFPTRHAKNYAQTTKAKPETDGCLSRLSTTLKDFRHVNLFGIFLFNIRCIYIRCIYASGSLCYANSLCCKHSLFHIEDIPPCHWKVISGIGNHLISLQSCVQVKQRLFKLRWWIHAIGKRLQ